MSLNRNTKEISEWSYYSWFHTMYKYILQYSLDNGNLDNGKKLNNGKNLKWRNFLALLFNKNTSILEIFKNWKPRKWKKFEKNSPFFSKKRHFLRNFWNIFPIFFHMDLQLFFVIGKWLRNSPITMFFYTTTHSLASSLTLSLFQDAFSYW